MKKLIVFSSKTCAPCRQLKPALEEQAQARGFAMTVVDMSLDNQSVFAEHNVRTVPTVVCVDGETEVGRFSGFISLTALEERLSAWGL